MAIAAPDAHRRFEAAFPLDLGLTLAPLRHGRDDPTIRFEAGRVWLARDTDAGPATLALAASPVAAAGATTNAEGAGERDRGGCVVEAAAWGPGASAALDAVPDLVGLHDDPESLIPRHPLVRELQRRLLGLRMPRTGQLLPALIPAVLEQKVTSIEAHAGYLGLLARLGEPSPGPGGRMGLRLPVRAERLAALPYFEMHSMGIERRRAELLIHLAREERRIEGLLGVAPAEARAALERIRGLGPWTSNEATRIAFGDPDAVSVGDAHLPDLVSWALAREPRATDARMLEILAPYAGQRARVIRMLEAANISIPRFGPRFSPRRIAGI